MEQTAQASCLLIRMVCQDSALSFHQNSLPYFHPALNGLDPKHVTLNQNVRFSVQHSPGYCCLALAQFKFSTVNICLIWLISSVSAPQLYFHLSGVSPAAAPNGSRISDSHWDGHSRLAGHTTNYSSPCPPDLHRPPTTPEVPAVHQHPGHRHTSEGSSAEQEPPPRLLWHKLQWQSAETAPSSAAAATAVAADAASAAAAAAATTGHAAVSDRQSSSRTPLPDELR